MKNMKANNSTKSSPAPSKPSVGFVASARAIELSRKHHTVIMKELPMHPSALVVRRKSTLSWRVGRRLVRQLRVMTERHIVKKAPDSADRLRP